MIRWLTALLILFGAPALAQPRWDPAADYVTPGQDEPGYRAWIAGAGWRPTYVKAFHNYLVTYGVGGVAPTWQLLRTATDWQKCNAQPFEVPPPSAWPNIVAALRYVGQYVVPAIGPVEIVSVYRNPVLNNCAGGAQESTHRYMGAVDMVPLRPVNREMLITQLCAVHQSSGERNYAGLGLYRGLRFHIDAKKFRAWGMQGARGGYGCAAVLAEGAMPYIPQPAPVVAVTPASTDPLAPQR